MIVAGLCVASAMAMADQPSPITNISSNEEPTTDGQPAARFTTEAKWDIAGYNNEEIIYTILVTSHDTRVLRCVTSLQGSYYENGEKQSVSDRQLSTVFPDQQVQVGNWMGMDQQSGATYSVHCHAI
jgi:hypothetical protein